ncbi:methylosome subunit pICln isoform X1 [Zootermopsis nevadensis]|uniref:Methylosome subunit pICln n=1 Tax=Zootermopsis nevadensis TaxID=136037 RepID=A0A067R0J2_ZOONE|nr:methylosome subunit pICln isoform X1 [Zootermopsis nevadensis]KDR10972.1 Methylosome subunit pICln [Zootermopsis nevadensis]
MVVLSNFPPPADGIKHEQPSTTVHINDREIGIGTLFITESRLSWVNSSSGQGFSLEYPHIALHAVSRDLQAYPSECLYVLVDSEIDPDNQLHSSSGDEDSEVGVQDMTEMRFVPDDKGMLDAMFHAMSECQSLHPDPQDSFSEDEEIFEDADDEEGEYHLGEGDASVVSHNNSYEVTANGNDAEDEPMEMDTGQFEDADD